jgi:hypothetical protein
MDSSSIKKEYWIAIIVIVLALMICLYLARRQYAAYRTHSNEILREFKKVNESLKQTDSSFRPNMDSLDRRTDSLKKLLDSVSHN